MRKFLFGFLAGVVAILLCGLLWVRLGFVNPRADIPEDALERVIAMPALDASVDRRAPEIKNPLQATDANLAAGMKIYQTNCASCHGDTQRPSGVFAEALYPRAPQFVQDAPDMPENQNFYIIEHGIRLSGMPASKQVLSDQEVWQVTTFLSHMDKLPSDVSAQWKAMAGAADSCSTSK
jgi:mono/diheme cytochrome c family protein